MPRPVPPIAALLLIAFGFASAPAAEPAGWRTDGTGRYPNANPPTEWSPETNVVWSTELPDRSHAAPIVVDDRLFVASEPSLLLCLSADDGRVLWQRSHEYADLLSEKEAAEAAAVQEQARELESRVKQAKRALRDLRQDDAPEAEQKRAQERLKELEQSFQDLIDQYPPPKKGGSGNAAGTPVSDGSRVFVGFATGIVAAYTLDGERLWFRRLEPAVDGFGHSSSPALVDGKLVVHTRDMTALDASTGDTLWTAALPRRWGTPLAAEIGDEAVVVSPAGAIVKASDGTILAEKLFNVSHATPVVHDGVIYALDKKSRAIKLPERITRPFEPEILWEGDGPRQRTFASPLYHDGLLYTVDERGILDVYDAANGESVYRERLPFGGGRAYSSVTLAGDHLYAGTDKGETVVFRPGREYQQVALNELDGFSGAPVFDGERMYVRGYKSLVCVAK